jgi:NAD(P)-dependent dehydrogenase (short-subunit alcohol dehydrogenase family)
MSNQQKVAVITGASQGIGAGLVQGYRNANYRVVATSRSIRSSNDPDVIAIAGDIADPATSDRIISEGVDRFGRVDALVNNAGIFIAKPFTQFHGRWAEHRDNLAGFFHISQRIRKMRFRPDTSSKLPLSLASISRSTAFSVLTSLTAGGLNAATKSLPSTRGTRHRINAVRRLIKTPMHAPENHKTLGGPIPWGTWVK